MTNYLPLYALGFSVFGIIMTLLFIGLIRSLIDAARPDPVPAVPGAPAPAPKRANDPKRWIIVTVAAILTVCFCMGAVYLKVVIDPSGSLGGGGPVVKYESVTMAEYERVKVGMTYDQVVQIVGFQGENLSEVTYGNQSASSYAWSNDDGSNMIISFTNGRVSGKGQFGLP